MSAAIPISPELIPLANRQHIREAFGVAAKTLIHWHETLGFPLVWPAGRGIGKTGYVPVREARVWFKQRSQR